MLAMLSVILLRLALDIRKCMIQTAELIRSNLINLKAVTPSPISQRVLGHQDYFSYKRHSQIRNSPLSSVWSQASPSPSAGHLVAPPMSSPTSSRGSWSSLFNSTSMRKLITGLSVKETLGDQLTQFTIFSVEARYTHAGNKSTLLPSISFNKGLQA